MWGQETPAAGRPGRSSATGTGCPTERSTKRVLSSCAALLGDVARDAQRADRARRRSFPAGASARRSQPLVHDRPAALLVRGHHVGIGRPRPLTPGFVRQAQRGGSPHGGVSPGAWPVPSSRPARPHGGGAAGAGAAAGAVSRMKRSSAATTAAASCGEAAGATMRSCGRRFTGRRLCHCLARRNAPIGPIGAPRICLLVGKPRRVMELADELVVCVDVGMAVEQDRRGRQADRRSPRPAPRRLSRRRAPRGRLMALAERIAVAIVGGGQAGLSMSWNLTQLGIEHVVLERSRAFAAWHHERWDAFTLVTPNFQCRLPGHPFGRVAAGGRCRSGSAREGVGRIASACLTFLAQPHSGHVPRRSSPRRRCRSSSRR